MRLALKSEETDVLCSLFLHLVCGVCFCFCVWCVVCGVVVFGVLQIRKYARNYQRRKVLKEHEVLTSNPMMSGGGSGGGGTQPIPGSPTPGGGDSDSDPELSSIELTALSMSGGGGSGSGGGGRKGTGNAKVMTRDDYQSPRSAERKPLPVNLQLRMHHQSKN